MACRCKRRVVADPIPQRPRFFGQHAEVTDQQLEHVADPARGSDPKRRRPAWSISRRRASRTSGDGRDLPRPSTCRRWRGRSHSWRCPTIGSWRHPPGWCRSSGGKRDEIPQGPCHTQSLERPAHPGDRLDGGAPAQARQPGIALQANYRTLHGWSRRDHAEMIRVLAVKIAKRRDLELSCASTGSRSPRSSERRHRKTRHEQKSVSSVGVAAQGTHLSLDQLSHLAAEL